MVPRTSEAPVQVRLKDQTFRAFAERRRRFALRVLQQHQRASLSTIAQEIAMAEDDGRGSDVPSDAVTAVHIDLYHRHVPILTEAGLVRDTSEENVVALSEWGRAVCASMGVSTGPDSR